MIFEAQDYVVGCWLLSKEFRSKILDTDISDFSEGSSAQRIFKLIYEEYLKNQNFDISDIMLSAKEFKDYIRELTFEIPTVQLFPNYYERFKHEALQRKVKKYLTELCMDNGDIDVAEVISRLSEIATGDDRGQATPPRELAIRLYEYCERAYKLKGSIPGFSTGYKVLDYTIGGILDNMFIIVGGRPAMGKSAFAINLAWNIVKNGGKVLYASVEMSEEQILARITARVLKLSLNNIKYGAFGDEHWKVIAGQLIPFISQSGLHVLSNTQSLDAILQEARRLKVKYGKLDLLVVDYIQTLEAGHSYNRSDFERVSTISKALRNFAKSEHVPVLGVAQLNRECEGRENKRPVLSDLRESSQLEYDADVIMFLYRPAYYDPDFEDTTLTELIIAKNRDGQTGTLLYSWFEQIQTFVERENVQVNSAEHQKK